MGVNWSCNSHNIDIVVNWWHCHIYWVIRGNGQLVLQCENNSQVDHLPESSNSNWMLNYWWRMIWVIATRVCPIYWCLYMRLNGPSAAWVGYLRCNIIAHWKQPNVNRVNIQNAVQVMILAWRDRRWPGWWTSLFAAQFKWKDQGQKEHFGLSAGFTEQFSFLTSIDNRQ